jgi:hypothetical protein
MQLELSKINFILKNIEIIRNQRFSSHYIKIKEYDINEEDTKKLVEIYKTDIDNIFLKLTISLNSYSDETIIIPQFVTSFEKTITVYQSI